MIQAVATFIARGFAGEINHLVDLIVKAVAHEGFSFLEILQPAVPYHNWKEYRNKIEYLDKESDSFQEALKMANDKHAYTIGVFYITQKPIFHKELYSDHNPILKRLPREERLKKIAKKLNMK